MICTKQLGRIDYKDVTQTLDAIDLLGFDEAIEVAYDRAIIFIDSEDNESKIGEAFLLRSEGVFTAAKDGVDEICGLEVNMLSFFYKKLAHRIYRHQRREYGISENKNFIRRIK